MSFEIRNFKLSNFLLFLPAGYVHCHQNKDSVMTLIEPDVMQHVKYGRLLLVSDTP